MPPFDWLIRIDQGTPASLDPGTLEKVKAGDTVTWGNKTDEPHHPWPTRENGDLLTDAEVTGANAGNYLSDEIPGQRGSRPTWVAVPSTITNKTILYCCKLHQAERGKIIIL